MMEPPKPTRQPTRRHVVAAYTSIVTRAIATTNSLTNRKKMICLSLFSVFYFRKACVEKHFARSHKSAMRQQIQFTPCLYGIAPSRTRFIIYKYKLKHKTQVKLRFVLKTSYRLNVSVVCGVVQPILTSLYAR